MSLGLTPIKTEGRAMRIERFAIPDVLLVTPHPHPDTRGVLSEVFRADLLAESGVDEPLVQENQVFTHRAGTLRGLHFQAPPHAQGKLVRCVRGSVWDVALDIRVGSPTFGRAVAAELSASNGQQMWVPVGFAHGYLTLEDGCEVVYKLSAYHDLASERGIAWDDPALAIDWRLDGAAPILSAKDLGLPRLADANVPFVFPR
jgi:dTDP-4-dehydrorhamnose 3,5-epimerase